jgi:hypothetical protein
VNIPHDAVIPDSKLTEYLLDPRPYDAKSKYLLQGGYTKAHTNRLKAVIFDIDTLNHHSIHPISLVIAEPL